MTDNLVERLQVAHDDPMWADHVEMPKRFIAEILAALRAATALGAGEPVAWRYRHSEQENWYYGPDAKGWWECQPLYAAPPAPAVTEGMVDHMVSRFLQWKLPEAFCPDGGISFKADYNENTPWPMRHEPVGTNLFDFGQASDMVRHMLEGLPVAALSAPPAPGVDAGTAKRWPRKGDRMRFLNQNGYDHDRIDALKVMKEGDVLTVKSIDVGEWHHTIEFEEVGGRHNGVMFVLLPKDESK